MPLLPAPPSAGDDARLRATTTTHLHGALAQTVAVSLLLPDTGLAPSPAGAEGMPPAEGAGNHTPATH
jgi:hypothetical protein